MSGRRNCIGFTDESILSGNSSSQSMLEVLLDELEGEGFFETLGIDGKGLVAPSVVYNAFTEGRPKSRLFFERFMEVIAEPGCTPMQPIRTGDLIVRIGLAEPGLGHLAVITNEELMSLDDLKAQGITPECHLPGLYAIVNDRGARPQSSTQHFARLVTDETGHMPYDQMILRIKQSTLHGAEQADESPIPETPFPQEEIPNPAVALPSDRPRRRRYMSSEENIETDLFPEGDLTTNFSLSEFSSRGTPVPEQYLANVRQLAENLQVFRDHIGRAITITSGYRTPEHNASVGGASQSQHLTASAADIRVNGLSPNQVYCAIEELIGQGAMRQGGLGIYTSFVHYDIRGRSARWAGRGASTPDCRAISSQTSQLQESIGVQENIFLSVGGEVKEKQNGISVPVMDAVYELWIEEDYGRQFTPRNMIPETTIPQRFTFDFDTAQIHGATSPSNKYIFVVKRYPRYSRPFNFIVRKTLDGNMSHSLRITLRSVPPGLTNNHNAFPNGQMWRMGENGIVKVISSGGRTIDTTPRTTGAPESVTRVWQRFGNFINHWAEEYVVPCELIVPIILQESIRLDETSVRIEPLVFVRGSNQIDYYTPLPQNFKNFLINLHGGSYNGHQPISFRRSTIERRGINWNDVASSLNDLIINSVNIATRISPGLMQTLVSTARSALGDNSINVGWLLEANNSLKAGIAYISQQRGITNFDPPKVTAGYNAGGVYSSSGNPWKMRTYASGRIDRYIEFFNDFVYVMRQEPSRLNRVFPSVSYAEPEGERIEDQAGKSRPRLIQSDAAWAADGDSPDHRHLLPESFSIIPFSFTPENLEKLCSLNRFLVPTDATRVIFGLRACTLVGDSVSTGWTTSAQLVETTPNHAEARCVLGVWDRSGGRIMVFKGSTVPSWSSMERFRQGGERCNLLSTGFYRYTVGTHRPGHRLEIKGAFRQQGPVVVLRTLDDLIYEVTDPWDSGHVGDNIHPARRVDTMGFSSEGCHTIPGKYDKSTGVHSGFWTDFRKAAGLTPTSAPTSENGRQFVFVLLTGREARLVDHMANLTVALSRLRFGSQGTDVQILQQGMSLTGHYRGGMTGIMDVDTTRAYIRWQQSVDWGRADAIVTPDDGRALGFDMIRQVTIVPVPWRRGGSVPWYRQPTPTPSSGSRSAPPAAGYRRFVMGGSVGIGGKNVATDVAALKNRLIALGYDWVTPGGTIDNGTTQAIKLFQSIIAGSNKLRGDGRVDVPGRTYEWLQAVNAPRWQTMPAGSAAEGFRNIELADTTDKHDYGTNWLADVIVTAAAHYRDNYLNLNTSAALLTVNDASLQRGGDTKDHAGHETGLACDLRLPWLDGTAPGNTTWNRINKERYDRNAARGVIQALRAQPLVSQIYFNDGKLIQEGLCQRQNGHDDHIHFQINPPARGAVEI